MTATYSRIDLMRQRLQHAFAPEVLIIHDDSAKHQGHAGSRDGAGHYTVEIKAAQLCTLTRVAAHRAIYQVLQDLIPHEIHALRIIILQ